MDGLSSLATSTAFVALAAYAGINVAVTGPIVSGRYIDIKEQWGSTCKQAIAAGAPKLSAETADLDQKASAAMAVCKMIPGPMQFQCVRQVHAMVSAQRRALEARKRQAMSAVIGSADNRCSCAKAEVQKKHAYSFAWHTASLRFVTPPPVKNLRSELKTALHSGVCKTME